VVDTVSPALARRIALGAQGFGRARPASVGIRQLSATIDRLNLLQLDSVNVFERSHYLPIMARLGPYDKAVLDRMTFGRRTRHIEYWAHEAAVIPVDTWPLLRWRMQRYREKASWDQNVWAADHRPMIDWLLAELADKGPLPASAVEHDANKRVGPWWGWSDVKSGLEALFRWGDVVSAGRARFERTYALPEQILSDELIDRRIEADAAHRELVERSLRALGIGTTPDVADYFRLSNRETLAALLELESSGEVLRVDVPGWRGPTWMHAEARRPRRIEATALLSPFDPVVWERPRAERMFGFHYRIEIYTPAPKRVFGYYSLPILLDDSLVGRVDLKSDRQNGVLRVQSAWNEEPAHPDAAARLAPLLRETAAWQGLDDIEVMDRGTLADGLATELGVRLSPQPSSG
jgi:uncharacterized protein YcaQ